MINKRVVLWVADAANQKALACKIAMEFNVVGIVVDTKEKLRKSQNISSLVKKAYHKLQYGKIDSAWHSMQSYYSKNFPSWPKTQLLYVPSINSTEAYQFTNDLKTDLVVVSGTSLIKDPLVSMQLPTGIMNLHTGLSPYVKGGPNCTNWCISNNEWSLIGNTIMWLSAGIDSGNIITSERINVDHSRDLSEIHITVMEHAHDLYLRAIKYVLTTDPPHQSVPQKSLGSGNLYLTKMWTSEKKKQLLNNLSKKREVSTLQNINTVPLP